MDRSIHWAICRQTVAALSPRAHPRTGSAHMQIMSKLFNFLEARTQPIALCRSSSLGIGFCFLHKCFPCTGSFYDFFRWTWNSSWTCVMFCLKSPEEFIVFWSVQFYCLAGLTLVRILWKTLRRQRYIGKCIIVFHTLSLKSKGYWIARILTRM